MSTIDREIFRNAKYGRSINTLSARTILGMLQRMEQAFGDQFEIDRACDALDDLAEDAIAIKEALQAEKARRKT